MKKFTAAVMAIILAIGLFPPVYVHAELVWEANPYPVTFVREGTYHRFLEEFGHLPVPTATIPVDIASISGGEMRQVDSVNALVINEDEYITFTVNAPQAGLYALHAKYFALDGYGLNIEFQLEVNGERPYFEARYLMLPRIWRDARSVRENRDSSGNEMRPAQVEVNEWFNSALMDSSGMFSGAMLFKLEAGPQEIRILVNRESVALATLEFVPPYIPELFVMPTNLGGTGQIVYTIEAEEPTRKSTPMLIPEFDRASPLTSPISNREIILNMMGGNRWNIPGQWLEYEFTVPHDGYFKIAMRARQNLNGGTFTTRRMYINGEIPAREAENIRFYHANRWEMVVPQAANGENMYFWLEAGTHTLRLEAALGDVTEHLMVVQESLVSLNESFRDILMLTGPNPDPHRDYFFQYEIPQVFENFEYQQQVLREVHAALQEIGFSGERLAIFERFDRFFDTVLANNSHLVRQMNNYRHLIGALGTWQMTMRESPLDLDKIFIAEHGAVLPRAEANIFHRIWHEIRMFINSFFTDFNAIRGDVDNKQGSVTVWTSASRDQVNIIRQMIDETFSPDTGIEVNLQLVAMGALLPSVLAGIGPDVALSEGSLNVLNFAARGALMDLTRFDELDYVLDRFPPSTLIPLQHLGGQYALPETFSFPLLFYRQDILADMGLSVPDTWDDVFILLSEIMRNNMEFGLPTEMGSYPMFLFQKGGELYVDNNRAVDLTSDAAVAALRMQTEMFISYELPLAFDFANRFRTGEMPIAVQDFTAFNLLTVFAPEIRGVWQFAPLPGMIQEDGSISRATAIGVTGTVMLAGTSEPYFAFEFMDWFSSTPTQLRYGRELETVLGAAARYNTANVEAMRGLGWHRDELAVLEYQLSHTVGIPEVPGGYYTGRFIGQAFREVVLNNRLPREVLIAFERTINEELEFKRMEFGIE